MVRFMAENNVCDPEDMKKISGRWASGTVKNGQTKIK